MNATTIEAVAALVTAIVGLLGVLGVGKHSRKTRKMFNTIMGDAKAFGEFQKAVDKNNPPVVR